MQEPDELDWDYPTNFHDCRVTLNGKPFEDDEATFLLQLDLEDA